MNLKLSRNGKESLSKHVDGNLTIKDLKSKLEYKKWLCGIKYRRFDAEYVILLYNSNVLEDKKLLSSYEIGGNIDLCLDIKWKVDQDSVCKHQRMKYNDTLKDFIDICCNEMNVSYVHYGNKNIYTKKWSTKCLRKCLLKGDGIFTIKTEQSKDRMDNHGSDCSDKEVSAKKIKLKVIKDESNSDTIDINIVLESNSNADYLRRVIASDLKIGVCNFDIYFNEQKVVGDLMQYNFKDNDTLVLKYIKGFGEAFLIKIRNPENEEQRYLIDDLETVGALKLVLREQYNINVNSIKLSLDENELQDDKVIREMNIESDSIFTMRFDRSGQDVGDNISIKIVNELEENTQDGNKLISVSGQVMIQDFKKQIEELWPKLKDVTYVGSYKGDVLKNENLISTYGISDGDEVVISGSLLVRYFMAGSNASAKVSRYPFYATDTVGQLKMKITKKLNLEAKFINLSYDGRLLEDDMVLVDEGIENESYLMMLSTLAGGI